MSKSKCQKSRISKWAIESRGIGIFGIDCFFAFFLLVPLALQVHFVRRLWLLDLWQALLFQ